MSLLSHTPNFGQKKRAIASRAATLDAMQALRFNLHSPFREKDKNAHFQFIAKPVATTCPASTPGRNKTANSINPWSQLRFITGCLTAICDTQPIGFSSTASACQKAGCSVASVPSVKRGSAKPASRAKRRIQSRCRKASRCSAD